MPELMFSSPFDRVLFLRNSPDFALLDPSVLVAIASHCEEMSYPAGERIYTESDAKRYLYFLVEGTVRTSRAGKTLFDVTAPGAVGLMRALARNDESAAAMALTDVVTLRIGIDSFLQVMEDHFALVLGLIRNFSSLIAQTEARLGIAPGRKACDDCIVPELHGSLDLVQRMSRARRSSLFAAANLTLLSELLRDVSESYIEAGEWLFRAGQPADDFFLVFEGVVRVENSSGNRVAYAGQGDLVALSEYHRGEPHAYGAVAETAVQLLRIDVAHYLDLLEDHFDHSLDLLAELAQRYIELKEREHRVSS